MASTDGLISVFPSGQVDFQGEICPKKFLSHASSKKKFLALPRGVWGHAPLENFENLTSQIG